MDEGYEKIMEIIEMNRFRQRLGLLDYTACWEEPDCKTANCGRSFLRIVFDDSSFQTALSGRMKRDFVGIAAGFRRFISADHRWSVETRL